MNIKTLGQLATTLINRSRFANVAGITFGGKRDLYEALGYQRQLFPMDYRSRYNRNGVAARIVECKPQDTWRGGGQLMENDDPSTDTPFETAWDELNKRLRVWPLFEKVDILAGIGRYAIIVLGAPGVMEEPLEKCSAQELKYLSVYAEEDAVVAEFETDQFNERYGLPKIYNITRTAVKTTAGTSTVTTKGPGKRVHWSRVQHVADGLLDDQVYGTPRLERCWNLLDDLEKVTGGGAEAFWKRADGGLQLDLDPMMDLDDAAVEEMKQQTEDYVHGLKKVVRTRGMSMNRLGSDVANFKDPVDSVISQISAGTGIPQRVLMGSEQGKLAADQDSIKYYRSIEARRLAFAETHVVRPFVNRMIELGVLPPSKEYVVQFSQIRTMDDDEKALLASKWAQLNTLPGGIVVLPNEIRERCLGLQPLTPAELPKPEPVAAPTPTKDEALLGVLEAAIEHNKMEVVEHILGIRVAKTAPELVSLTEQIKLLSTVTQPSLEPELRALTESIRVLAEREMPTPVVNVNVEPPTIVMPSPATKTVFERDKNGLLVSATKE